MISRKSWASQFRDVAALEIKRAYCSIKTLVLFYFFSFKKEQTLGGNLSAHLNWLG